MTFTAAAAWFVGGAIAHLFISRAMNIVHGLRFLEQTNKATLAAALAIIADLIFAHKLKRKILEDANVSEAELEIVDKADRMVITSWQTRLILKILTSYPEKLRKMLPYKDWDSAIEYANKLVKDDKID